MDIPDLGWFFPIKKQNPKAATMSLHYIILAPFFISHTALSVFGNLVANIINLMHNDMEVSLRFEKIEITVKTD